MNQHLQNILNIVRQDEGLTAEQKDTIAKSLKDTDKELEITAFKLEKTEKIKRTTAILLEETIEELEQKRKAVEAQNKELEIESSLERVRAVAMGMRKPDDLLDICEILYTELLALGFSELRNAMINIHNDAKAFLLNYDYSDNAGKTVTNIPYNFHLLVEKQVLVTKNARDAFFEFSFTGEELKQFRELRKNNGEQDDAKLEITDALYYYFYSIGTGSIGISTYSPVNEEKLKLLKRFRNVFNLSWQRYADIKQAEAQAREAKIEAALERARTQSMLMQHSSELSDTLQVFHQQLQLFGINSDFSYLWLPDEENDKHLFWAVWEEEKNGATIFKNNALTYPLDREEPYTAICLADWKSGVPIHAYKVAPAGVKDYFAAWGELFSSAEKLKAEFFPDGFSYVEAYMKYGCFGIAISRLLTDEEKQLLRRFAIEFERAYSRFLDLQKAEAQAREAQIEAALERVRSRTMAMQRSDELQEAAFLLFQQVQALGARYFACGFNIWDDDRKEATAWMAREQGFQPPFKTSSSEDVFFHIHEAAQRGETLFVAEQGGQVLETHYQYMASIPIFKSITDKMAEAGLSVPSFQIIHCAFFSQGYLMFISFEPVPDAHDIFKRFAKVFDQTYTRFLDLQKAEAQARESQIQLAMERVRARTMAMQHSDELSETATVLFEQLNQLGEAPERTFIGVIDEVEHVIEIWATLHGGNQMNTLLKGEIDEPFVMNRMYTAWKEQKKSIVIDLQGHELEGYFQYLKGKGTPVKRDIFGRRRLVNIAFFSKGMLGIITTEPRTAEAIVLYERFAGVFDLTYTRFLDLQKAEAQAREAKIELGLERVRARAMAMQKSDELSELVDTVFKELTKLDFALTWCIINIIDEPSLSNTVWAANPDINKAPESYHMLFEDYPFHHAMMKGWKERKTKSVYTLEGDEKRIYDDYLFSQTEFKRTPGAAQAASRAMEKYVVSFSFSNFGGLQTVGDVPLSDANLDILSRFGKVFDLTYTRFNDLKQAEAQARESQIQLALERVRSRTMAMHKSEELKEIIIVVSEQLQKLGYKFSNVSFITHNANYDLKFWMSSPGVKEPILLQVPYLNNPAINHFKQMVENDIWFSTDILMADESLEWNQHVIKTTWLKDAPQETKNYLLRHTPLAKTNIRNKHIAFAIGNYAGIPYKDEENEVFKRFANVFEQSYTRFLDLQKAEAQAREAKIEAALEKVRSRSLGMHKSEELQEVVTTVLERLEDLDIQTDAINLDVFNENKKDAYLWTAVPGHKYSKEIHIPYNETTIFKDIYEGMIGGKEIHSKVYSRELKDEFLNYVFEYTDFRYVPEERKEMLFATVGSSVSVAYAKNTAIIAQRYRKDAFSDDDNEILKRFARVFEQAYTRFLDLQKAEAQARESQMQLALERVRARTMAMQRSEELAEVATVLFQQVKTLGVSQWVCGFSIWEIGDKEFTWYPGSPDGKILAPCKVPLTEHPVFISINESRLRGDELFVYEKGGEFQADHYRYMMTVPGMREQVQNILDAGVSLPTFQIDHIANFSHGNLIFITYEHFPEMHDIFKRFAKVFEQTYTRFLDLQKAEAQARESQIQLALERVRARTMAMQKSDELPQAANLLFQQVQSLGMPAWSAGYCIWDDDKQAITLSMSSEGVLQPTLRMPLTEDPSLKHFREAWEREESFFVEEVGGEALKEHYTYLRTLPGVKETLDDIERAGFPVPTLQIFHLAYFTQGFLLFITYEQVPEAHNIFKRFAKVFEQTYTRFLDLQKAEAQAREAQIEAALERVRSRSMGMQQSEELRDVIQVIYEQFIHLKISIDGAGFAMDYMESDDFNFWLADPTSAFPYQVHIPYFDHPQFNRFKEAKEKGLDFYTSGLTPEERNRFFDHISKYIPIPQDLKEVVYNTPGYETSHVVLKNVILYILNFSGLPFSAADNDTLMRFGRVFEQTYTRFNDLKKAEAQAREAQIETALERVRSRSMGMQKSEELKEVIQVVYEQFVHLNIHVEHTGFIMDYKERNDMRIWLADKHAVPFQVTIPYFDCAHWNSFNEAKGKGSDFFANKLSFEEKNKFYQDLFKLIPGVPEETLEYYLGCPGLAISTVLLENVGLYIENFSGTPYSDEENRTLMRFGKVFQQTYTRFLDLQRAEAQAREAQIEAALEKVRSRSLAMHNATELGDVVTVIVEKLRDLGVVLDANGVILCTYFQHSKDVMHWIVSPDYSMAGSYLLPYFDHPIFNAAWQSKENGDEYFSKAFSVVEKNSFFEHAFEHSDYRYFPDEFKQWIFQNDQHILSFAWQKNSAILIPSHTGVLPSEEDIAILKRFAKVFEQSYVRFLDLQKAEAQAKESQIQLALERVRARTMAMQHSDELKDAAAILFQQAKALGVPAYSCGYNIWERNEKEFTSWMSTQDGSDFNAVLNIPLTEDANFIRFAESRRRGEQFFVLELRGERMQEHYEYLKTIPAFKAYFDYAVSVGYDLPEAQIHHVANFSQGNLLFITLEPCPEFHDVFKRFAAIFEQTYTRFLDLQKAEAQAREAQIETALEKVRSRSLAMHKSDELQEVVHTVFGKLKELDVELYTAIIIIFTEGSRDMIWWLENKASQQYARILVPYRDNYYVKDIFEAKEKGTDFFSATYSREEKNDLFYHLFENTDFKYVPEQQKQFLLESDLATMSVALAKYTGINITSYTKNAFSEKENEILKRFAKVFDQAYTRFLDLQRAEAQAREAQIEAALERVRSRAMAMQNSSELSGLVAALFEELTRLNLILYRCIIWIFNQDTLTARIWMANSEDKGNAESYFIKKLDHPYYDAILKGWEERNPKWVYDLHGQDKKSIDELLLHETELSHLPESVKAGILLSEHTVVSGSFNNFGLIEASGPVSQNEEQLEILNRFGKVFDHTYTRFNDLKQAEAQAREAKIEAALERVRGKAMAMHDSQDLATTIAVFYRELQTFSITPRRCGVGVLNKATRLAELSTMNTTEEGDSLEVIGTVKMQGHPVLEGVYDNWLIRKEYHPVLRGNEIKEYYQLLRPQIAFPDYPNDAVQYGYFFFFNEGGVFAWTEKEMKEDELQIYRRFTTVLSLTYKRYIDLKQAETNAKEAVKQAALDRIRADIASMRTVADLDRITPLIWNELNILGVPFIRCGVFIMDDSQQLIHTFLSSPDGKAIAAFHLPYDTPGNLSIVISHWKDHQNYIDHWEESAFTELAEILVKQGAIASPGQYLDTIPHGGFYLHFLPFLQGMLYVGNTTQLSDEDIHLIQSVADAFSTAYARYEDFNKLEAAKQTVDKTLVDLKQAQTQLVQSEKMASLGELTAGIAHEIQNPLNFVNNFSEVSNELLDEMIAELGSGAKEDAIAIANDVKQNLEKILHHGKRADGIVKGMLQHSRSSTAVKELTDINKLADEYLRLAYHGLRAKDKSFNATLKTNFDESIGSISIIPQDIGRAVLNLITNAFYVVGEKTRQAGNGYEPTVTVSTRKFENRVEIRVTDNGNGIPPKVLDKIFQPFFTTKPTGQGTGLGLSLSYDIVKAHGGELKVETKEGQGTEFIIQIPVSKNC